MNTCKRGVKSGKQDTSTRDKVEKWADIFNCANFSNPDQQAADFLLQAQFTLGFQLIDFQ